MGRDDRHSEYPRDDFHTWFNGLPKGFRPVRNNKVKRKKISKTKRRKVYERDNYTCRECKSLVSLTIDHIVPLYKGGNNMYDNLQTLCRNCNNNKAKRGL